MEGIAVRKEFEFEGRRLVVDVVHTKEEFFDFMGLLQLRKPFIVKPNWICMDFGHFTDPQVLQWMLRFSMSRERLSLLSRILEET